MPLVVKCGLYAFCINVKYLLDKLNRFNTIFSYFKIMFILFNAYKQTLMFLAATPVEPLAHAIV